MPKSVHIVGADGIVLELDSVTPNTIGKGRMVNVDAEQHYVNTGERFSCFDYDPNVDSVKLWHLKTPGPSLRAHVRWQATASKSGTLEIFKNATLTDDGDVLCIENDNQCAGNACSFRAYKDPTVTDYGTRVSVFVIGSDSTAAVGGSGGNVTREKTIVLAPNSSYIARFTAQSVDTRVAFELHFFEIGVA